MITKVSSVETKNVYSANKVQKKNAVPTISSPPVSETKYVSSNVMANYMPLPSKVSFGSTALEGKNPLVPVLEKKNPYVVKINTLKDSQKIKGNYYESFSDDVAILLGSENNMLLTVEDEVDSEIFAHNFADLVAKNRYEGMGMVGALTDVVYIKDPDMASLYHDSANKGKNSDPKKDNYNNGLVGILKTMSKSAKNKIVIIDKFESMVPIAKLSMLKKLDMDEEKAGNIVMDMRDYFDMEFPNLNIIGIVSKEVFNEDDSSPLGKMLATKNTLSKDLENFSKLELSGLNTSQAKKFFKNNPIYLNSILMDQPQANLQIGEKAISNLVEKAAIKMDMALPVSAGVALKRLTIAKVNETKNLDENGTNRITSKDVDNFFERHGLVMEEFKPETGTFSLAENVKTKLSDVGGISSIKEDIQEDLIAYLKNPKQFVENRGIAPKGVLLEGPPGTGKTLLARAIAGETNTPFISASGSEFVEKYVGVGAQRVRELFQTARNAAKNSPNNTAIVFIDEFDAIARSRTGGDSGGEKEYEHTLNQLLTEMDGFSNKESKIKIVVIAATNRKDMLDDAAIRPGRFDDVFTVSNPRTTQDRLEIMNIHAKGLKFVSEEDKLKILSETANLTSGMSGAELAGVMNRAKRIVAKREDNKFVTYNDIVEGYLQTISGPVQKNADDRPIEDVVKTVRHEGGHATVIDFLAPLLGDKVSFITLDQRGSFLGAVFRKPSEMSPNFRTVVLSAAVGYAGGMAEPNFDKQGRSAGVSQDVSQATKLFRKAITEWGQGVFTPPVTMVPNSHENDQQSNAFYETMRKVNEKNIAKDVALFSATASTIAAMINKFHKGFLDDYVNNFKENAGKGGNNLSGDEFSKLRKEWVVKNSKEVAEKKLLTKIDKILNNAMNKNSKLFQRITARMFQAI